MNILQFHHFAAGTLGAMDGELVLHLGLGMSQTWRTGAARPTASVFDAAFAVKGWIEQGLNQGMGEPWVISLGKKWENDDLIYLI